MIYFNKFQKLIIFINLDEEKPPPKEPSPEVVEDIDAERAFEKLRKAAHVRPWDHGKDGLQKPCTLIE